MLTKGQRLTRRYDDVQPLSQGGMGAVYRATDRRLGISVAIKENCVADPAMRVAFRREAELMANLQHPSLPKCKDFFEVDGVQFLVMDFIEGDDLATMMVKARAPLSNKIVDELAWQMSEVLAYLEEEGISHRDIKPRNIKFVNDRVYLIDFGIAYGVSGEMDTIGVGEFNGYYGSERYSPPEQLQLGLTKPSGDIYSMAATLYYVMTNVQPVGAEARLESLASGGKDPLEDVRSYNRAADERMSRAVMLALSLKPEDRPQSVAKFRELMFPKAYAPSEAGGVRRFLNLRLLSEVFVLGVFACILIFVLRQPRMSEMPPPLVPDTRHETQAALTTPIPTATPTPGRTSAPAEKTVRSSRAEQSALLVDEAAHDRQSGKIESALSKLRRAGTLDEKNPSVPYLIGDIRWEQIVASGKMAERIPEVLAAAERVLVLTRSPRSGKEYLARAWANAVKACCNRARPDRVLLSQAIADANEVLKKYDSDSAPALTIRASATYVMNRSHLDEQTARRVLEDFNRVIRLTPLDPQAHANLAEVHLGLAKGSSHAKHLELARQSLEEATRLAPRGSFYKDLGEVYRKMGNFREANENFRAAESRLQRLQQRPNGSGARQELQGELSDRAPAGR